MLSPALSRRPPAANPAADASTATVSHGSPEEQQPSDDIIVRDEHGKYRLDIPLMTPMPRDEAREEREVENKLIETYVKHQQHVEPAGTSSPSSPPQQQYAAEDQENQKAYLDVELRAMLQASLQAKVASLEEDKWMFERDDGPIQ